MHTSLSYQAVALPDNTERLVNFLCGESWPFHSSPVIEPDALRQRIADGAYTHDDSRSFWVLSNEQILGMIRIFDLDDIEDGAPLFDLRICSAVRGQGIGEQAVNWINQYLFTTYPQLKRIEGTTRVDNHAMRQVFRKCNYAKEGHYRQGWGDGKDAVHYAILRQDWLSGNQTPVGWNDES